MGFRNVVNDGSSNPPRMRMQYSAWAMTDVPHAGEAWPLAEGLEKIVGAGFTGYEANCRSGEAADELAGMLHERGLGIGFAVFAENAEELLPSLELAHRVHADYLNVLVKGSLKASPDIADLLEEMYELANDSGFPLFVETHRGTVTQDLRRTVKVLKRFKKIRFTGDFSHYVVSGDLVPPWDDEVWEHLGQIAKRCGSWHGRIGFGNQVQNDIGDGSGEMAQQFKKLWSVGMSHWLRKAEPGDVLPFTCELGPAPYAMTDASGREFSNRWEQSLVIKRLAEEAWADAGRSLQADEAQTVEPQGAEAEFSPSEVAVQPY